MGQLIDFTRYNENIRWTLANGWNIYIWNRMLQDQERKIANEEKKLLSTAKKGAPPLNPANIGMPIDPDNPNNFPDEVFDASYNIDPEKASEWTKGLLQTKQNPQVQFMSTPLGDNYFYDNYIQRLNQEEDPKTFSWKPKGKGRLSIDGNDIGEVADFQFGDNITTEFGDLSFIPHDCENATGDFSGRNGKGQIVGPQHNSKEQSPAGKSSRILERIRHLNEGEKK